MKERPILFSGPMVRAILEGRKTVTRRVVRTVAGNGMRLLPVIGGNQAMYLIDGMGPAWSPAGGDPPEPWPADRYREISPYGVAGDRLWVKETFQSLHHNGVRWVFRATDGEDPRTGWDDVAAENRPPMKWRPSIYMPRHVSRLTLEVTAIRVERLHLMTDEDALAEGMQRSGITLWCGAPHKAHGMPRQFNSASEAFADLWDEINGKRVPWARNPWVWVVSFRRIEAP